MKARFSPDIQKPLIRDRLYLEENVPDAANGCTFCAITDGNVVFALEEVPDGTAIVLYLRHDLEMGQADHKRRHPNVCIVHPSDSQRIYGSLVGMTAYEALQTLRGPYVHVACRRCEKTFCPIEECHYCRYYVAPEDRSWI